jgi:DNA replication and repair protein RecF
VSEPSSPSSLAGGPVRVALTALSLRDFRNYAALELAFGATLVVLTGPNGAGKTNLLEAISLLAPGRGLRRATFDEIVRAGSGSGWTVAATLKRNGEETRLGTTLVSDTPSEARTRRVRINGAPMSSADALLDYLRILWLTPSMDGLFTGPPGERRRFLDRLVLTVDPGHARRARDFERLVAQRNWILEEGGDAAWLDAVEVQLAAHAVAVALARSETATLLSARMEHDVGAFPAGRISVSGDFEGMLTGQSAAEAELCYRDLLAGARAADRASGRTLQGPHRSDVEVVLVEKDAPAARSSTGEQKALLIGLVLAHAELVSEMTGMRPVLLLDEVTAHLDPMRRFALFERLAALGSQVFVTGTDRALFADLPPDSSYYRVSDGSVIRAD